MTRIEDMRRLLDQMDEGERRQVLAYLRQIMPKHPVEERLMISAEGMLHALDRAGDFTVRMIRGIFAEAAFATEVLPRIAPRWREVPFAGDRPYDFLLTDVSAGGNADVPAEQKDIRVQVKMQRSADKKPLYASDTWKTRVKWPATHFVVEVQKSRKGEKKGRSTRPYRFGEFDLLAVSLGPARGNWSEFIYTVERWLLPDPEDPETILKYQPVSPTDCDCWTTRFEEAVRWLRSGEQGRLDDAFRQGPEE